MKFPGVLPLAFFLLLVPILTPVIEKFAPTATTWWSAALVAVLGAASSALWLVYRSKLSKAGMPTPSATPTPMDSGDYTTDTRVPTKRGARRTWLLG